MFRVRNKSRVMLRLESSVSAKDWIKFRIKFRIRVRARILL